MPSDETALHVAELVARAGDPACPSDGRLAAFEGIVRHYQGMVQACALAILGDFHQAEDAAQEAFLIAYDRLGELREPAAFGGWLHRVVTNHCLGEIRRRKRRPIGLHAVDEPAARPDPLEQADEDGPGAQRLLANDALAAIRALPEEQRTAIVLHYVDGYSQKEIAEFLGIPVSTLKVRLFRSRSRLRKGMAEKVQHTVRSHPLADDFAGAVVRRAACAADLAKAAEMMHYNARVSPNDFRSAEDAAEAGIFMVGEPGRVTSSGYFRRVPLLIGGTVIDCCRASCVAYEAHGAPHPAFIDGYKAIFRMAREQGIAMAVVHGSQYDHAFCGFVPSFYYHVATLPVERARQVRTSAVVEPTDAQERQAAERAFMMDPHGPKVHPPMSDGDVLAVRQDGQVVGYVRINSRLTRSDAAAVMSQRPLDYTVVTDVAARTRDAALAAIRIAGELTAAAGRDTICMMQPHTSMVVQTMLALGGTQMLRRPCNSLRMGSQMACILDLPRLMQLLETEFRSRLAASEARDATAAFSLDVQGEIVGFVAEAGELRIVQTRQAIHRYLPHWIMTRLCVGFYGGADVLAMGPLPWDRGDGMVPDDLQLDNSALTLPQAEAALLSALFPKLWPSAWPDTDVWAWILGQQHPPYYFGHDAFLSDSDKKRIDILRFPWLDR